MASRSLHVRHGNPQPVGQNGPAVAAQDQEHPAGSFAAMMITPLSVPETVHFQPEADSESVPSLIMGRRRNRPLWCGPTASISSMKRMQGAFFRPCSKRVPDPTGTDSDKHFHKVGSRHMEKGNTGFTGDRFGKKCFIPVPGCPTSRTPLGMMAPSFVNRSGFFQEFNHFFQFVFGPLSVRQRR